MTSPTLSQLFGHRIAELLSFFCGNGWGARSEFAKKLGIHPAHLNKWIKQGQIPSGPLCAQIVEQTGCSAQWLLTGKGEMFDKDQSKAFAVAEEGIDYNPRKKEASINVPTSCERVILRREDWEMGIDLPKQ